MNRRLFIKKSAVAATMLPFINLVQSCKTNTKKQKIFVLIQLVGGNDGLNTLIPLDNFKNIVAARSNLFIPENKVLTLKGTSINGLHPALEGVRDLYNNGLASFVQSVGYENQSYSHFRSADIWLTGSEASKVLYTGWMARFLETRYNGYPEGFPNLTNPDPPAIKVGESGTFAFQGEVMDMSIVLNPLSVPESSGTDIDKVEPNTYAGVSVKNIREIFLQTDSYTGVLKNALDSTFTHSKLYPKKGVNPLADQLKVVAELINAGLQTPVYMVDLKGFDTHAEQVSASDTTKGSHANLLKNLSQAITCFWDDMNHIGRENDVAGMVFSEFGRRIISNNSLGTDHGAAQPLLFFGSGLNGDIIGKNPSIPDKVTVDNNIEMQYDFRNIYSSILNGWFNVSETEVKDVLFETFPKVNIFGK